MTIALLTESWYPVVNGVTASVRTLADELMSGGDEVIIVCPDMPGADLDPLYVQRVPSWVSPWNTRNPFAYPPYGPLSHRLDNIDVDIVHSHHPFGLGLYGHRLARRLGVPHVSTFHTLYFSYIHYSPFPPPVSRWWLRTVLTQFYSGCALLTVPSKDTEIQLRTEMRMPCPMEVHPTGVSLPGVVDAERAAALRTLMGILPDDRVVLYVGRIAWEKNCRLLLESFARLPENCHLVMVGGGPDGDSQAEYAAELGMDGRTYFVGPVSREHLVDYYGMADIFAFPSYTETQGLVLGEAQSCGLPCVAVTGGGAAEFVRNNIDALVVPPELDAFAGALLRLVADDVLRNQMSAEALASPVRPSVAEMVSHIRQMYVRLIEAHQVPSGA